MEAKCIPVADLSWLQPNWDGYGAKAIPIAAFEEVRKFIQLLPVDTPMPELCPEPDGAIGLEWYVGPRQTFVVSVYGNNKIDYAGMFGEQHVHGTKEFCDVIPPVIMEILLQRYGKNEN